MLEVLEEHEIADEDGDIEGAKEIEEVFEDADSKAQKAIEKAIRTGLRLLKSGIAEVAAELEAIDKEMLGEEEDDDDDDSEEDD